SDLLIDLADAYTGMNASVFSSTLSAQQASVYDVGEWLNLLGSGIPEKEVLDYFLLHFSAMDAYDIIGQLLQVHAGKYECEQYVGSAKRPANMPYTFTVFGGPELNREFTLDQFTGMRKILALYSSDCPSSVASLVALYGFISRNQVRLPVILVPGDEAEGEIATIIKNHAPFGMQTGMKLGSSLMLGAGIRQLPAYIILDQRNMLSDVFYSFEEIKNYLGDK
ncbi:MAG TPA: hypothetical protein VK994_07175, partial [Bacteroidales bacterium]|nr:hypothetical protein [Bacteroidales bacterium]